MFNHLSTHCTYKWHCHLPTIQGVFLSLHRQSKVHQTSLPATVAFKYSNSTTMSKISQDCPKHFTFHLVAYMCIQICQFLKETLRHIVITMQMLTAWCPLTQPGELRQFGMNKMSQIHPLCVNIFLNSIANNYSNLHFALATFEAPTLVARVRQNMKVCLRDNYLIPWSPKLNIIINQVIAPEPCNCN